MPGAADNLSVSAELQVALVGRGQEALELTEAEGAGLVWAGIAQCVECSLDVEDADRSPLQLDDLALTGRNIRDSSDDVLCHYSPLNSPPLPISCFERKRHPEGVRGRSRRDES